MRRLTVEEYKDREIKILDHIDDICKENDIKYSIFFGTLLGAIRHKGFIPWDDDIDIVMSRKEYEKFINTYNKNEEYELLSYRNRSELAFPFTKICDKKTILKWTQEFHEKQEYGLFVDIFPYDNLPDNRVVKKIMIIKIRFLLAMLYYRTYKVKNKSMKEKIEIIFAGMHSTKFYNQKIDSFSQKYNSKKTQKVYFPVVAQNYNKEFLRVYLETFTRIEFEGSHYMAPLHYDECLTILYKKYMELPPIDKRKASHEFEVYVID